MTTLRRKKMAKTKAQLTEEAKALGLEVDSKLKIADIQALINSAATSKSTEEEDKPLAKAGKRSAKAVAEKEEKVAKEERKKSGETDEEAVRPAVTPSRSRAERRGKLFRASLVKIEQDKSYGLDEAIKLAKETSHVKFDATVELHVNLGVDPRHADQNVRDNLVLPSGTGKAIKIAVLSDDEAVAKTAGADIFSAEAILADLDKGAINFDILIASPSQMPKLGKYARTLGPRGLMPNPKSGTVSNDVTKAVAEAKAGRVEYRVDSTGIVHLGVGKVSFTENGLKENIEAVFASLRSNKPNSVKGSYIKAIHLSTTMGPSITIDLSAIN
jgi:large subunit ribosomal protein L1